MRRTLFEPEHEDFRQSVREFLDRHVHPRYEQFIAAKSFPRDLWVEAGKQGFLGLGVPEEYGGGGSEDYRFNIVLDEELAKVSVALGSCFGIHTGVYEPYLTRLTTEEQKRALAAEATAPARSTSPPSRMTEPGGGSRPGRPQDHAVRDGDAFVVNGSKTFITNGYSADLVIVTSRTDPGEGRQGDLAVRRRGRHARLHPRAQAGQGRPGAADTAELFFDNVRVPAANLIGELDRGFVHMMQQLPQERLGAAVSNLAHCRAILVETLQYAKDRKAFGQQIGSFQANKFLLAELFTKVEVTQAFVDDLGARPHGRHAHRRGRGQGQVVDGAGAERGPRRLRAAARWLRLHERVPGGEGLAGRPGHQDLGRLQ